MRKVYFFLMIAFFAGLTAAQAEQAEVMSSSGDVQVRLNGTEDYAAVQEGMLLESGDAIKTGAGGTAELSFNQENSNVVRLSENTAINVTFSGDEKLQMSEGEVFASIAKLESGSTFEIRTPTVVSGARGTDWVTKVTDEGTDVEAINDEPYVRHFDRKGNVSARFTPVPPGQMTTVKKGQKPKEMRPVSHARREQWQKVKQNVKQNADIALIKRGQRPQFDRNEFMRKRQKPAAMPSEERFQGKNVLESGTKQGAGVQPGERKGFKPLAQTADERDRFKPLTSTGAEGKAVEKDRERDDQKGFRPLASGDAQRKKPEYGELKSAEDRKAIKETQRKIEKKDGVSEAQQARQKREGKGVPAAQSPEAGADAQSAGQAKQGQDRDRPVPRPAPAPARR